jgi:gluconokinase
VTVTAVVMGVAGVGKSTVGEAVAQRLGWRFVEGDDFHSAGEVAKMHGGHPLTDEDRWPWLHALAAWIGAEEAHGEDAVVTCSALRRAYRDLLRDGHPSVRFVHLVADPQLLADRIGHRHGHFMPASLLDSQLHTLEPLAPDEPGVVVPAAGTVDEVADRVVAALGGPRRS